MTAVIGKVDSLPIGGDCPLPMRMSADEKACEADQRVFDHDWSSDEIAESRLTAVTSDPATITAMMI